MKKLKTYLILSIFLFIQCSEKKNFELVGVWKNQDSTRLVNYYEAHITDSEFVVVSESGLSYLSSYKIKSDTIIQYLKDHLSNLEIIDTVKFIIEKNNNSIIMRNSSKPELYSEWIKIEGLNPYNFEESKSLKSFALNLKERYFNNYVSKYVPKKGIDDNMKYFDINWKIKKE
jgi:hypothetical protein